ncbi:MAG: type II toxin-antitoxin system VapB family antitoxin [Candidatus Bipolaricaulota bacterium]
MKRLSVTVDPELIEEAMNVGGVKTKRELIEKALREFVRARALARLRGLAGGDLVEWTEEELARWRESVTGSV